MQLLTLACPELCPAGAELPKPFNRAFQTGGTQCGFYCLGWLEADYRWLRGEGDWAQQENLLARCPDLNRWLSMACKAKERAVAARAVAKAKAEAKAAAKAAKVRMEEIP